MKGRASRMKHLPIFLDLARQRVLVVGGGQLALRKVRLATSAGADVTLVAPKITAELVTLAAQSHISLRRRPFVPNDLEGAVLVFAATDLADVDTRVAELARVAGIPVNAVDRPAVSTFIIPSIVDRDPITIAVSSGGTAPLLVRRLRGELECRLPAALGRLACFAGSFRSAVKANIHNPLARLRFWERFFDGPVASSVLDGDERQACQDMLALVNGPAGTATGEIVFVGAGPGDPDLLTLAALHALQAADVIVHDQLSNSDILNYARRDAQRMDMGNETSDSTMSQGEINTLLVRLAIEGKRVVRLKNGNPTILGQDFEELAELRQHGIPVRVVPGITAAAGYPESAGAPLTYRDHASAMAFFSNKMHNGLPEPDWEALARGDYTLAVYTVATTTDTVALRLMEHGMDPETPSVVVENGTLPGKRVLTGTLGELGALVSANGVTAPVVIVIGEVGRLMSEAPVRAIAV